MAEKCPMCGAPMRYETVRDYNDDGSVEYDHLAHQIDGLDCSQRQIAALKAERDQFALCLSLMGHAALLLSNCYLDRHTKRQLVPGWLQEEGAKAGWESLKFALQQCDPPTETKLGYSVLHRCIEICGIWLPSQLKKEQSDD